jgi:ribosomal protein S18 acetylase RimI-like enzyme
MTICEDWRDVAPGALTALYGAERERWLRELSWDLGPALQVVEQARLAGHLPGVLVRARDGSPGGWAFYVLGQGVLQIGALSGTTAAALRAMLDRIFRSAEAQMAQEIACFLFPVSPSVRAALLRQRFVLHEHDYMRLAVLEQPSAWCDSVASRLPGVRPWSMADSPAAVRLMARAYAGDLSSRCFSPHGRLDEWAHYVGQLLAGPGCGTFQPEASFVVPSDEAPSGLGALVMTTLVGPATAHVAQLVVDPAVQGRGVGRALLQLVAQRVRTAGAERLTLIVGQANPAARALYTSLGFSGAGTFLYGRRGAVARVFEEPTAPVIASVTADAAL